MGHVNAEQYKKFADAIANDFVTQGIPLNTSVKKLASAMDLSTEQIKRLCEASNNATFNQLFHSKDKTAADRIIEFDVAKPEDILGTLIEAAEPLAEKQASLYEYRPLGFEEEFLKVAETIEDAVEELPFTEKDHRTLRKAISHLTSEKLAWEMEYHDKLAALNTEFKKVYGGLTFDNFEKTAYAVHGDHAVPELSALRELRRLNPVTYTPAKIASVHDDTHPCYAQLAELITLRTKIASAARAVQKMEKIL